MFPRNSGSRLILKQEKPRCFGDLGCNSSRKSEWCADRRGKTSPPYLIEYAARGIEEIGFTRQCVSCRQRGLSRPQSNAGVSESRREIAISANAADFKFMKTNEKRYTEKT